jgi:hypothetical protein
MSEITFTPVAVPATTRKVMDNPFIEAVQRLVDINGTEALEVVLPDPTSREVNRAERQLTDAGNQLGVTVRRQKNDVEGTDDVRIVFFLQLDENGNPTKIKRTAAADK